jgi:hypothetical protein
MPVDESALVMLTLELFKDEERLEKRDEEENLKKTEIDIVGPEDRRRCRGRRRSDQTYFCSRCMIMSRPGLLQLDQSDAHLSTVSSSSLKFKASADLDNLNR